MRVSILFILLCIATSYASEVNWDDYFPYGTYINEPNTFKLYWKDIESESGEAKNELIEFGMEVKSTGWIAIGISPNTKMPNSDIMLAWVDDNDATVHLYDMYTLTERVTPFIDNTNDLTLIDGEQIDGKTRIRFRRAKYPCNDQDKKIEIGTTRIIYAYNDIDPIYSDVDNTFTSILQHSVMGSQSLNLDSGHQTGYNEDTITNDVDMLTHEIRMDNHTIHAAETTYYCQLFELPSISLNNAHHIVKFEPIISVGNEAFVHHIILYSCEEQKVNASNIGHGARCEEWGVAENMPAQACIGLGVTTAVNVVYVWAVGMENSVLPSEVGIDFGGITNTNLRYGMLEMHYDNPGLVENIIDHSGFKIYYTPNLRTYSAGIITLGHFYDERHFIPKGLTTVNYGYCMSECTQHGLPKDGVTIFNSFLHLHPIGTAINLRLVRNGQELEAIDADWAYDFDYQQMVSVDNIKLLPGDDLILECYYSNYRNRTTFGGIRTSTEMCLAFLWVYPKPDLVTCVTTFIDQDLTNWENGAKLKGYLNDEATVVNHTDYTPFDYDINMEGAVQYYNNLWHNEMDSVYKQRYLMCFDDDGDHIYGDGSFYKDNIQEIPEERSFNPLQKEELCYDVDIDDHAYGQNHVAIIIATLIAAFFTLL